jgi:hypothetical protein
MLNKIVIKLIKKSKRLIFEDGESSHKAVRVHVT